MKFKLGDTVRKIKGSEWKGTVVGTYSTALTPEGYAVESSTEKGSVQIYPASALELWKAAQSQEPYQYGKAIQGGSTCFKCGHAKHLDECVNVAPSHEIEMPKPIPNLTVSADWLAPSQDPDNGGGCTLAGPGRGDCEHYVGLPGVAISGQHDGDDDTVDCYGKPNGWCWSCWKSKQLSDAAAQIAELESQRDDLGDYLAQARERIATLEAAIAAIGKEYKFLSSTSKAHCGGVWRAIFAAMKLSPGDTAEEGGAA